MKKIQALVVATQVSLALASPLAWSGTSSSGGIGNPASENCDQLGGKLQILVSPAGEEGYCNLDRAMIEEWTLWGATTQQSDLIATQVYLEHPAPTPPHPSNGHRIGMPNPASVYCGQVGGKLEIVKDKKDNEYGVCRFDDKSTIEEWTLFNGPDAQGNHALTLLLKAGRYKP